MDSIEPVGTATAEVSVATLARSGLQRVARATPLPQSINTPTVVDMDILPELLGYNVRSAQLALQRDFTRTMEGSDIGPGIFGLLVLAGANPGISQIQIATHLDIDKASVVALVDRLEGCGWVMRRRSTEDRRKHGIFLTGEGTRELKSLKRTMKLREQALSTIFNAEERQTLISLLQRIRP